MEVASFESRRVHGKPKLKTIPDGWRVLWAIVKERLTPLATAPVTEDAPESGLANVPSNTK